MAEGSPGSISLRDVTPLGTGRFRHAFIHPDDERKCIKIDRTLPSKSSRLTAFVWKDLGANEREILEYNRLISLGIAYEQYFPKFYGLVDTDLGPGLCVELLKGSDGKLPMPLTQCIKGGLLKDETFYRFVKDEYRKFSDFCERNLILSASAGFENAGIITVDGAPKLISFDLKAITTKQFIPILDWSPTLKKKKIRRRFGELMTKLNAAAPISAHR